MTTINPNQKQVLEVMIKLRDKYGSNRQPIMLKEITSALPDIDPRNIRSATASLCKKNLIRRGVNIKNNACFILLRISYKDFS